MVNVDIQGLKIKVNELLVVATQMKMLIDQCEKCESALNNCEKYSEKLEEVIVKLLRGEIHDLHIELSIDRLFEFRSKALCLPEQYYAITPRSWLELICVRDTPLGKLLLYTPYDAVLNPSEETIREIVQEKVKPELQEEAMQKLREFLGK